MKIFGMHVDGLLAMLVCAELAIFFCVVASVEMTAARYGLSTSRDILTSAVIIAVILCLLLIATGAYRPEAWRQFRTMVRCLFLSGALGFMIALALQFSLSALAGYAVAPPLLVAAGGIALLSALGFRLFGRWLRSFLHVLKPRVVMLGSGDRATRVAQVVAQRNSVRLLGMVPEWIRDPGIVAEGHLLAPTPAGLAILVRDLHADEIVVAVDDRRNRLPIDELLACRMAGVAVLDDASFVERERGLISLTDLSPSWLIFSDGFSAGPVTAFVKRTIDLTMVLLLLLLVAPFLPVIALAIRLDSPGPTLYRQVRVGLGGRHFTILKFRSMVTDAEHDGRACWAQTDDPRITRVGRLLRRFRIDELPQLLNVLNGDMSFVGPRPERPEFVAELASVVPYYDLRHNVRPGLTGWAQINYRYGASIGDSRLKLEYDLYYLKHRNLALDILILLQTVRIVLSGDGAH